MEYNRMSWNEYFMNIACLSALRSRDPHTKVGACIVSDENRIISIGYNGAPKSFDDNKVPWNKSPELPFIQQKYPYMCHAELNSVVNYNGSIRDFKNCTLYVTLFPCNECAKLLAQLGIKKIIYKYDIHHDEPIYEASRRILDECGIVYEEFKQESNVFVNINIDVYEKIDD